MTQVIVKNSQADGATDIIRLTVKGVSSEQAAERAAFRATGLEEGPVCTGHIERLENGDFFVSLKGEFNTADFYEGQVL